MSEIRYFRHDGRHKVITKHKTETEDGFWCEKCGAWIV